MKKIKSNKLLPKLVATLTICMVLLSSLSVSAFAADDELSAANEKTESITDVWTDVMNWITSSLSSVQGVFVEASGSNSIVLNSADIFEADIDFPYSYFIALPGFDPSGAVPESTYTFQFLDSSYDLAFVSDDFASTFFGDDLTLYSAYVSDLPEFTSGSWYLMLTEPFSGSATLTTPFTFVGGGSYQLTFLGTLSVIGVSISIAFLLIALISRFFRLRG